jgi:hypothetical protein
MFQLDVRSERNKRLYIGIIIQVYLFPKSDVVLYYIHLLKDTLRSTANYRAI